jgi:glycopeptide antibiotics resistance protein
MSRVLLGLWALFIVYGSFIPFRLTTDPGVIRRNLADAWILSFADVRRSFSLPDVLSNVLLYIPLGLLLVVSTTRAPEERRAWRVVLCAGIAAVFSTLVEIGQLFTVNRTTSLLDVVCNTTGGLLGAVAAAAATAAFLSERGAGIAGFVRRRPLTLVIALIALAMLVDRLYPFAVTLDVSATWRNVKRAAWTPFESVQLRFWWDVLVDLALPPALLAALLRALLARPGSLLPACTAWLLTVAFVAALEVARVFVAPGTPNVDYVIFAGLGGLIGVTAVAAIAESQRAHVRPGISLLLLAVALLAYSELAPFDFNASPAFIAAKLRGIEWLPFETYYVARARSAMYDAWIKMLLSGFLGFAWANATGRGPLATAGAAATGLVLETMQLLTVSRRPSVTDVLVLAMGAYVGGLAHRWYGTWRGSVAAD